MPSALKNIMQTSLTGSATDDLYGNRPPGEGDMLKQRMEDEDEERKKKKALAAGDTNPGKYGDLNMGPATSLLFGRQAM